jgi:hypothetical protein
LAGVSDPRLRDLGRAVDGGRTFRAGFDGVAMEMSLEMSVEVMNSGA